jgi:uncharacterized repeat protein (TIGR01451 family)
MSIKKLTQILSHRRIASLGVCAFLLAGLTGFTGAATAQSAPVLEASQKKAVAVVLTQSKVVKNAQGKEQLVDASSVKPGDIVEYRAVYTNNTGKPVTGLVADLPIPEGLEYQPRSAKPGAGLVQAATKEAVFGAEPLVRKAAGNKSEPVPYADYRSLRWTLGQLPANGSTAVSARAKVEVVVVPPAPLVWAATPQAPPATAQR